MRIALILSLFLVAACSPPLHPPSNPALEILSDGEVHHEGVDIDGAFTEHQILKDPLRENYIVGQATANQRARSAMILGSGTTANRIDLVIVGDGYAEEDLGQYAIDASRIAKQFFAEEPLRTYANYFNVHRVDVISQQSGVDNDPAKGIVKKNALGMNYFCNGIERLLCANIASVKSYAANAPAVDHILAVANSSKYGGAGYWDSNVATLAGQNENSIELALHEIGHSFAKLGDEYSYDGSNSSECAKKANGAKMTAKEMLARSLKWFRWLDLPHVGSFEGTCYKTSGIYRPTADSKMRSLGKPLYEVNTEQYIFAIYEKVKPIDAATAPGTYDETQTIQVVPMRPNGSVLQIKWFVDQIEIPNFSSESLDVSTLHLGRGRHTVKVRVQDTTPRVRDESKRAKLMTQERSWTINVER